tara:strand:+ start:39 stop:152 length:114 start_codon:yes stop_codon:yes gene_type:complete
MKKKTIKKIIELQTEVLLQRDLIELLRGKIAKLRKEI